MEVGRPSNPVVSETGCWRSRNPRSKPRRVARRRLADTSRGRCPSSRKPIAIRYGPRRSGCRYQHRPPGGPPGRSMYVVSGQALVQPDGIDGVQGPAEGGGASASIMKGTSAAPTPAPRSSASTETFGEIGDRDADRRPPGRRRPHLPAAGKPPRRATPREPGLRHGYVTARRAGRRARTRWPTRVEVDPGRVVTELEPACLPARIAQGCEQHPLQRCWCAWGSAIGGQYRRPVPSTRHPALGTCYHLGAAVRGCAMPPCARGRRAQRALPFPRFLVSSS